jgi:hypothetical protein
MFNGDLGYKVTRKILALAPQWLLRISVALLVYMLAANAVVLCRTYPSRSPSELNSLRAISAQAAFIFAAAATVLMAYIRSDGPIKRDEI